MANTTIVGYFNFNLEELQILLGCRYPPYSKDPKSKLSVTQAPEEKSNTSQHNINNIFTFLPLSDIYHYVKIDKLLVTTKSPSNNDDLI